MNDPPRVEKVRTDEALRRFRTAVSVLFLLGGMIMGGWAGRIPTVKDQVQAGDGLWGLLILAAPIGAISALLVVTKIIASTGAAPPAKAGALGLLLVTPLAALSGTPWMLAGLLLLQGIAQGLLFSPINALAVEVEQGYRRSILSSFHAWFSVGQLGGGLLGVLAGAWGIAPGLQLAAGNLVLAGLFVVTARWLPKRPPAVPAAAAPAATGEPAGRTRLVTRQVALLLAIAFLTAVIEGTAAQWSALFSVSVGASVAVGSLTMVCFSLSIALVRTRGDLLVQRWGHRRFVMLSAAISALGMGFALIVGTVPAALIGFAMLGVGSGSVLPAVTSLIGNQPEVPSGRAVALMGLGAWPAFLIAPPLIGGLSELAGLRWALTLVVLSAVLILALTWWVRVPPVLLNQPRRAPGHDRIRA